MKKKQKNTFKAPVGYFEDFNERLFSRLNTSENETKVDFLPKSDGFGLPDHYFESVYPKIYKNLNKSRPKILPISRFNTFYYATAAIAAIFVLTLFWNQNQTKTINFEDLASADIEEYFENHDWDLFSYEILETLDLSDISITDINEQNVEEEIFDYLDKNIDDIELNYEELYN